MMAGRPAGTRVAVLLALLCIHSIANADPMNLPDLDVFLRQLADNSFFGGMAHVTKGSKPLFSKGYGQAVPELGVKMRNDHRYAIGSNTKLFTAVAMWQLHAQKKINIYDTVDKYLDSKDFGLSGPWCPRLINVTTGPCQVPTFAQLLSMQSGLLDTDNCKYSPDAWQAQYCWSAPKGVPMTFAQAQVLSVGAASPLTLLKYWKVLDFPLQYTPGTTYSYINANFLICAYVLEKITGLSTQEYFTKHLFVPAGLKDTLFDTSQGNDGINKGMLFLPGYYAYLSPLSLGISALDDSVIGDFSLTAGDPVNATRNFDAAPYGTKVKLAKINGAFNGFPYGYAHAAGAIISTGRDMSKWFRTLTRQPWTLNLTVALVKEMFSTPKGCIPLGRLNMTFCQGIITVVDKAHPLGTKYLFYNGNLGYDAVEYVQLNATDPSQDLHVSFLTYQQPFTQYFNFAYRTNNTTSTPEPTNPATSPSNGKRTCLMSLKANDTDWYKPSYGSYGGMPTRDAASYARWLARATQAGNRITKGPVPAPHVLCDAAQQGMGIWLGSVAVNAALGTPWFGLPPATTPDIKVG